MEDPSYKYEILHFSTHNTHFRGCNTVNQPHLPNHTWFWVINMSNIAVEPSTYGQYGGQSKCDLFTPPIGYQCTPLHLVDGLRSEAILYNSVNEEDIWKDIANWVSFKGKLLN